MGYDTLQYLSVHSTITNVCHASLYECTICAMCKKLKLSSGGWQLAVRYANEAKLLLMVVSGGVCIRWESGVRQSVLCLCI